MVVDGSTITKSTSFGVSVITFMLHVFVKPSAHRLRLFLVFAAQVGSVAWISNATFTLRASNLTYSSGIGVRGEMR